MLTTHSHSSRQNRMPESRQYRRSRKSKERGVVTIAFVVLHFPIRRFFSSRARCYDVLRRLHLAIGIMHVDRKMYKYKQMSEVEVICKSSLPTSRQSDLGEWYSRQPMALTTT